MDRSIHDAIEVERLGREEGYDVEHCQILIEEAVRTKNLVIAPDGITGNIIFRTMHLVDGCVSMGAPILNLGKVFIDTSRAKGAMPTPSPWPPPWPSRENDYCVPYQ